MFSERTEDTMEYKKDMKERNINANWKAIECVWANV